MKNIELFKRRNYGVTYYHPLCEVSEILCKMMRRKTFPYFDFVHVRKLGYTIHIKNEQDAIIETFGPLGDDEYIMMLEEKQGE